MKLLAGNGALSLAKEVAKILKMKLTDSLVKKFPDNEIHVEINESVRGEDMFVIQSTSQPVNDNLMELLIIIDALKRASAKRINVVVPYFGYARQDRKSSARTPITAKLVADLLTVSGADRVITLDLHAGQIQGFFDIPVDNLFTTNEFESEIKKGSRNKGFCVVSPDIGGLVRARALAKRFHADLAIIDKRREKIGKSEVLNVIGDVNKKDCIIVDDIVDSAGTLCNAAEALVNCGAKSVAAYVTHGVLSSGAVERIEKSSLSKVVITNSINCEAKLKKSKKIRVISIAPLFAEAVKRVSKEKSVSGLFDK